MEKIAIIYCYGKKKLEIKRVKGNAYDVLMPLISYTSPMDFDYLHVWFLNEEAYKMKVLKYILRYRNEISQILKDLRSPIDLKSDPMFLRIAMQHCPFVLSEKIISVEAFRGPTVMIKVKEEFGEEKMDLIDKQTLKIINFVSSKFEKYLNSINKIAIQFSNYDPEVIVEFLYYYNDALLYTNIDEFFFELEEGNVIDLVARKTRPDVLKNIYTDEELLDFLLDLTKK